MPTEYLICSTNPDDSKTIWSNESERAYARKTGSGIIISVRNESRNLFEYNEIQLSHQSGGTVSQTGLAKISPEDLHNGLENFRGSELYFKYTHFIDTRTGIVRFASIDDSERPNEIYIDTVFSNPQQICTSILDFLNDPSKEKRRLRDRFNLPRGIPGPRHILSSDHNIIAPSP